MADSSISIDPGTTTAIDTRTEATNGNHRQVVVIGDPSTNAGVCAVDATSGIKVNLGADNDVTVTSGDITANAGTNLNTSALALEAGGNLAGAATSLAIIDDWDESDRAKVNPIVGQAGVAAGSGTVGATTQRVCLATDVSLPAGTNAIGKLSANSGVDIGDVDITSVIPGTGATNLGKAIDSATGSTDTGVLALVTRDDALSTLTPGDGDNAQLRVDANGALWVNDYAHTSGGESNYTALSTAAVVAAEIKNAPGQVFDIQCFNDGANEVFVRLYNQTGAPGTGDAANIVWRGMIPGNAAGAGFTISFPKGRVFSTGIGIRVTGAVADNDNTSLAANEVMVNVGYK